VTKASAGMMLMTKFEVTLCCGVVVSFTVICAVVLPEADGVPEITPAALMERPGGSVEDEKV